jgi:hypothetical protein
MVEIAPVVELARLVANQTNDQTLAEMVRELEEQHNVVMDETSISGQQGRTFSNESSHILGAN